METSQNDSPRLVGLTEDQIKEYKRKLKKATTLEEKDRLHLAFVYQTMIDLNEGKVELDNLNEPTRELVSDFYARMKSPSNFGGNDEDGETFRLAAQLLRGQPE